MDKVDMLLEPVRVFLVQVGQFLPKLALAIVVLIAGWMLAKLARFTVIRALRAINFNVLTERAGMDGFLSQGGVQSDTTEIFGVLIYWLVVLAALIIAFNSLGLTYITELLRQVVLFVPKVIVALLILAFGAYFARFVGGTVMTYCKNVGIQDGELLGNLAQYAIMTFVVLIALEQVDVGGEIVRLSFLILLGGAVFALALAFGLGGQAKVAKLLERWWPSDRDEDKR
jgi:flagellar biosynthesis protein FliQ